MKVLFFVMLCFFAQADDNTKIQQMYNEIKLQFPDVPDISSVKLKEDLASGSKLIVVDVRSDEERQVSIIPNSISKNEFNQNQKKYSDHQVIVYCTIGYRSAEFVQTARKRFNAVNLAAGILGWLQGGGVVVNSSGKSVKRVHVFGRKWALAPSDYQQIF